MRLAAVLLPALLTLPIAVSAQARTASMTGRVTGPDGQPIFRAAVRATLGDRTEYARTTEAGEYRLARLEPGRWIVSVRSVGHLPVIDTLELTTDGLRHDVRMEVARVALDPVLIAARWNGVRGRVVDARTNMPIADAEVAVMSKQGVKARSAADGAFAIERQPESGVVLRVRRDGFADRVLTLPIPEEGYASLDIALDPMLGRASNVVNGDLDQRLRWLSPRAAIIGRDEIERIGATSLDKLIMESPTVARKTLVANRKTCVFVNGFPRPGMPIDAIRTDDIDFIELFPAGTERTATLAKRWPPRAQCGAPSPGYERGDRDPNRVIYASVWTRTRRN